MVTVWVAHQQMRKGPDGERYAIYDTNMADEYGVREIIFHHEDVYKTPSEQLALARERMRDAQKDDWLVFCGAPDLCIAAAIVLSEITGGIVNMLIYDKNSRDGRGAYEPRRYDLARK